MHNKSGVLTKIMFFFVKVGVHNKSGGMQDLTEQKIIITIRLMYYFLAYEPCPY